MCSYKCVPWLIFFCHFLQKRRWSKGLMQLIENIIAQTGDDGTKNVELMVPLIYLSNTWRTIEMPLINCEINLDLKLSKNALK